MFGWLDVWQAVDRLWNACIECTLIVLLLTFFSTQHACNWAAGHRLSYRHPEIVVLFPLPPVIIARSLRKVTKNNKGSLYFCTLNTQTYVHLEPIDKLFWILGSWIETFLKISKWIDIKNVQKLAKIMLCSTGVTGHNVNLQVFQVLITLRCIVLAIINNRKHRLLIRNTLYMQL